MPSHFGPDVFCLLEVRAPEFDVVYTSRAAPVVHWESIRVKFWGLVSNSQKTASSKDNDDISLLIYELPYP